MPAKDTCPSCGEKVSPGDLLCWNCELILDPSQIPDRPSGDLSVVRRMLELPQRGVPSARPTRSATATQASAAKGSDGPTKVFALGRAQGVPLVVASLTRKAASLSELEAFVVSFIDGASDVEGLAERAGLGTLELGVVLQALHEKMIVDFADEPLPEPSAPSADETFHGEDESEAPPVLARGEATVVAPLPSPPRPMDVLARGETSARTPLRPRETEAEARARQRPTPPPPTREGGRTLRPRESAEDAQRRQRPTPPSPTAPSLQAVDERPEEAPTPAPPTEGASRGRWRPLAGAVSPGVDSASATERVSAEAGSASGVGLDGETPAPVSPGRRGAPATERLSPEALSAALAAPPREVAAGVEAPFADMDGRAAPALHEADAVEPPHESSGESIVFASSWPTVHPDFRDEPRPAPKAPGVRSASFVGSPTPRSLEPVVDQPSVIVEPVPGAPPPPPTREPVREAPVPPPSIRPVTAIPRAAAGFDLTPPEALAPVPTAPPIPPPSATLPELASGPIPVVPSSRPRRTFPAGSRTPATRPMPPIVLDPPKSSPRLEVRTNPEASVASLGPSGTVREGVLSPVVARPPPLAVPIEPAPPSPRPPPPALKPSSKRVVPERPVPEGRAETRPEVMTDASLPSPTAPALEAAPSLADEPPPSSDPRIINRGKMNKRVLDALKQVKRRDAGDVAAPREEAEESVADRLASGSLQVALRMEQNGRLDEAIRFLEKSIAQSPDAPSLYNRLAIILMRERADLRRSEQLLQKAVELAPENAVYDTNLKAVLAKRAMTKK